jgi:anti-sigma-K factor RskA
MMEESTMSDQHRTTDELIDELYGLSPSTGDPRLAELDARRRASAQEELPPAFLLQQRQRILARLDQQRPVWQVRFASAAALTAALALGVVWFQPFRTTPKTPVAVTSPEADAKLFQELTFLAEQETPRAGIPAPEYETW